MKKIIAFLCLLPMALLAVSCNGRDNPPAGADTSSAVNAEDNTTAAEETEARIVLNDKPGFKVIVPENGTPSELEAANIIRNKIDELIGGYCTLNDDYIAGWQEHDSEKKEILVGLTAYGESSDAFRKLDGVGSYSVTMKGNKLCVAAKTPKAVVKAARELAKVLSADNGLVYVPRDINITGRLDSVWDSYPMPSDGVLKEIEGDDFRELICRGIKAEDFDSYCAALTEKGYKEYFTNFVLGTENMYAQFVDDAEKISLTVLRTVHDDSIRIIRENIADSALPPVEPVTSEKICDPLFFMIGVCSAADSAGNGMSFLFRLSDGSFIVWDGGFDDKAADSVTYKRQNAARLLDLMKKNAPDPSHIRISAWFLTHPHVDHGGAMQYFFKNYVVSNGITVDRVVTWLPSAELCSEYTDGLTYGKVSGYINSLNSVKNTGAVLHRAHPGQVYRLADATVEVLYTDDLRLPRYGKDSNPLSVICRITLAGNTFMITGDTTSESGGAGVTAMYGPALKTDFLQLPHHTINVMIAGFYKCVSPSVILCPVANKTFKDSYLSNIKAVLGAERVASSAVKADFNTICFKLPYSGEAPTITPNTVIK
ncbi:MAG: MBL fold metallo-hydrolase [Clostridia bacterium]|nr:MBL fold metallo-hydrolase [Clostridia bacterium]